MQLKPRCTELSQLALRFKANNATSEEIIKSIDLLYQVLRDLSLQENVLDSSLADYVFFPLSLIFRGSKEQPVRAVEVAVNCLRILITCGWRVHISQDLGKQLLILLAFLAERSHGGENAKVADEELVTAVFECLESLFNSVENAGLGDSKTVGPENIPLLGHAISVVLDGIVKCPSVMVRGAALRALNSMINRIRDDAVLRRFVPGIISSLTKPIRPGSSSGIPYKIIQLSLQTLERLLIKVISDDSDDLSPEITPEQQTTVRRAKQEVDTWVQASSGQIKMALANFVPLQYHERPEVRSALFDLSTSILKDCRSSLSQSIPMMVETMIVICAQTNSPEADQLLNRATTTTCDDSDISEIVKSSLHDWIIALPRIMQSSDDTLKQRGMARVSTALKIISAQNKPSDILQNAMAFNLRSSVLTALQTDNSQTIYPMRENNLEVTKMVYSQDPARSLFKFPPVLFGASSQKATLEGLHALAKQLRVLPMASTLQRGVLESLRTSSGDEQLANLWLSLQLLQGDISDANEVDEYLNLPSDEDTATPLVDEVYSFALDILSEPSFEKESANWKLQALSLEVIALQAYHQQQDFRPELVDALFPILERMGSFNTALRDHALICLDLVSKSCAYSSPSALIVANADYLVNAVALKLNTFEISPQAPLVLVMMVKLCGPALVPYLDDLVETIFTILACFHGYPRLVESLFSVLHVIVEESGKASQHKTIDATPFFPFAPRRQPAHKPMSITTLANRLRHLNNNNNNNTSSPPSSPPHSPSFPPQPSPPPSPTEPPSQITLLLSIATQTQHHLTSPSTPLLLSLLSLLSHAFPALTPYQNQLLPLLATLFPLLLTRLHSTHLPQVCIAVCGALVAACVAGGDFLASRVQDGWEAITKTCRRWEREMRSEEKIMGMGIGIGKSSSSASPSPRGIKGRAWEAVTNFIAGGVVQAVGLTDAMEDDVFDLLGDEALRALGDSDQQSPSLTVSSHSTTLRNCLQALNPDMLWLLEMQRDHHASGAEEGGVLVPPDLGLDWEGEDDGEARAGAEAEAGDGDGDGDGAGDEDGDTEKDMEGDRRGKGEAEEEEEGGRGVILKKLWL